MSILLNPVVLGVGVLGLMILALVFAFVGMREGSLLYRVCRAEWVYRTRPGERLFVVTLGLALALGAPPSYLSKFMEAGPHHEPMTPGVWLAFALLVTLNVTAGVLTVLASGPCEIALNLDRRTYRRRYGWLFRPQVQTGPMDDMDGVYVQASQGFTSYNVRIKWKQEKNWCPRLGGFNRLDRAQRFAAEAAEALGLPLVETPALPLVETPALAKRLQLK